MLLLLLLSLSPFCHPLLLAAYSLSASLSILANEMDTRGIPSSRDQYNWGAYYKPAEEMKQKKHIGSERCVQKAMGKRKEFQFAVNFQLKLR